MSLLRAVHQSEDIGRVVLKQWVSLYHDKVREAVRQINKIRARCRMYGIRIPRRTLRDQVSRHQWMTGLREKDLAEHAGDEQPFFLYVGPGFPHPAFRTSKRWLDMVDVDAVTVPPEDKQLHPVMKYQRKHKNWMHGFSAEDVLKTRKIYYAMCAETDAMVGELMDEMDRLGLAENTYFIFSSDHGENNMEHRQFYKMNMYESSARVPLVIAGPGIQHGVILDNIVSLIDIYPTLMDMAGLKCPGGLDTSARSETQSMVEK